MNESVKPFPPPTGGVSRRVRRGGRVGGGAGCGAGRPRNYRVMFENDKVRVLDYASLPGGGVCGVGRHTHPAHVTVQLTPVKVRVTDAQSKCR